MWGKTSRQRLCTPSLQLQSPIYFTCSNSFQVPISATKSETSMDSDLCTIYCGSLSPKVTEEILYELFLQAGPLRCVKIPKTLQGESKLYGFVEYQHECSVDYAIQLFHHTALFGQELQLKRRRQNHPERVPIAPFPGMHRTTSLPMMMNVPMQTPPLFFRPPFITGFINPPANMLNYGLGMAVPMPTHIYFNDDGLPKTGPIPAILHGQYNNSILAPHHNTACSSERQLDSSTSSNQEIEYSKRKHNNYNNGTSNRHTFQPEEKKAKYSNSDKRENSQDEGQYRSSKFREGRRFQGGDHRSSRTDLEVNAESRRHRGDDHQRSRSHHDDGHQQSHRSHRDRNQDRHHNKY